MFGGPKSLLVLGARAVYPPNSPLLLHHCMYQTDVVQKRYKKILHWLTPYFFRCIQLREHSASVAFLFHGNTGCPKNLSTLLLWTCAILIIFERLTQLRYVFDKLH